MSMDFDSPSLFDLERLLEETFVRRIDYHRELDSTNSRGLELARNTEIDLPLLILAERQTAGRGRGSHRWWSADGALTFSIVLDGLKLQLTPESWPKVALAAGLAVGRSMQHFAPQAQVGLKWPNDVYLDGRKACGLLVEVPSSRDGLFVVGIGINVNNSLAGAPPELQRSATSLVDVADTQHDLTDVLARVVSHLDQELTELMAPDHELPRRWKERCLLEGRSVHLTIGSSKAVGVCRGIDADGALLLETDAGVKRYLSGTVTWFGASG